MPQKTVITEETLRKQTMLVHLSTEISSKEWIPNSDKMLEMIIDISPVINLYAHWDDYLHSSAELCKNKYIMIVSQNIDALIQSNDLPADTKYEVFLTLGHSHTFNHTRCLNAHVVLTHCQ